MSAPRLLSHLKRYPLTHDQALRLRVLVTFRDRQFSYLPIDERLLSLGLAQRLHRESVGVSAQGLGIALSHVGRFRLPERHPFFRVCGACRGAGIANEADLFTGRRTQARRCPSCRGTGCLPDPVTYPEPD